MNLSNKDGIIPDGGIPDGSVPHGGNPNGRLPNPCVVCRPTCRISHVMYVLVYRDDSTSNQPVYKQ